MPTIHRPLHTAAMSAETAWYSFGRLAKEKTSWCWFKASFFSRSLYAMWCYSQEQAELQWTSLLRPVEARELRAVSIQWKPGLSQNRPNREEAYLLNTRNAILDQGPKCKKKKKCSWRAVWYRCSSQETTGISCNTRFGDAPGDCLERMECPLGLGSDPNPT